MTYKKIRRKRSPNQIAIRSKDEIAIMGEAGQLVADCFALLKSSIQPGVRLSDLDQRVETLIRDHGAEPLYKGYRGSPATHPPFPGVICASLNNEICHGLPDGRRLRKGDIIGIDIGLRYKGYCGDACVTFPVGEISENAARLLKVAEECLYKGVEAARVGKRFGEIGVAIQKHANKNGYSVVREWGGHGIGSSLHESPSVPHTGPAAQGPRIKPGMIFTVEPMINAGIPDCTLTDDGWTVITNDGKLSAQFEHTIVVTRNGPEILSPWHKTIAQLPA